MTMFMIDKRPGVSIEKEEFESRLGGNIGSIETESDEEMDTLLKDTDYLDLGRSYERFVEENFLETTTEEGEKDITSTKTRKTDKNEKIDKSILVSLGAPQKSKSDEKNEHSMTKPDAVIERTIEEPPKLAPCTASNNSTTVRNSTVQSASSRDRQQAPSTSSNNSTVVQNSAAQSPSSTQGQQAYHVCLSVHHYYSGKLTCTTNTSRHFGYVK